MATSDEIWDSSSDQNDDHEREINILLLGETGVGKSTFINSFLTYLQFDYFEDASRNYQDVNCVIPSKFKFLDDDFYEKTVEIGYDKNENNADGESATLKTKSYVVYLPKHNVKVRLIDTPGICDTRGIKQDQQNQKNIINYLSSIEHINTICLLLKPNQTRCSSTFQYCISELLGYLHKKAIENIAFIFTNSRISFFKPGATKQALQNLFKNLEEKQSVTIPFNKDNVFCIDNEAFRYLLTKKANLDIGDEHVYSTSFEYSQKECLRILNHSINVKPYITDNTLYLYKAKQKLEELCNSVTDKSDHIKRNSILLKRLHTENDDEDLVLEDVRSQIETVESDLAKSEYERDSLKTQLSQYLMYLQPHSLVLFNDYYVEYINLLIDKEASRGESADKRWINNYKVLLNYYENMKGIIEAAVASDTASANFTREELSSAFPVLEQNIVYDSRYSDEVILDQIKVLNIKDENIQTIATAKNNLKQTNFNNWQEFIKGTDYIPKQLELREDEKESNKDFTINNLYNNENVSLKEQNTQFTYNSPYSLTAQKPLNNKFSYPAPFCLASNIFDTIEDDFVVIESPGKKESEGNRTPQIRCDKNKEGEYSQSNMMHCLDGDFEFVPKNTRKANKNNNYGDRSCHKKVKNVNLDKNENKSSNSHRQHKKKEQKAYSNKQLKGKVVNQVNIPKEKNSARGRKATIPNNLFESMKNIFD